MAKEQSFAEVLAEGKIPNSLGRAEEVVQIVLQNKHRLEELYQCLFEDDALLRLRAIDAIEKVCREHPDWLESYVDRFFQDFTDHNQPSIQWHLAEMFGQINLNPIQKQQAIQWLTAKISTTNVDWIVAADTMKTLALFNLKDAFPTDQLIPLLKKQQNHHSKSVVKLATKIFEQLPNS